MESRAKAAWTHVAAPATGLVSLEGFGHIVRLMAPQFVKPCVKSNKKALLNFEWVTKQKSQVARDMGICRETLYTYLLRATPAA